jgi:hypothetical protein
MPFTVENVDQPRFDGDFRVNPTANQPPTQAEQTYLDALARVMGILAEDEDYDRRQPDADRSPVIIANRKARRTAADRLRVRAEDLARLVAGGAADDTVTTRAADDALAIRGAYTSDIRRIANSLFTVQEMFAIDAETNARRAVDVSIHVARDLPPPNNVPSQEKQALFVALSNSSTVIRTVCQRMRDRADSFLRRLAGTRKLGHEKADLLLDQYMQKLASIGRLGLEDSHTPLANLALEGLRQEFVAREAGRIKNDYVWSLGRAAAIAVFLVLGLYAAIETGYITAPFWTTHKAFLIAAAGSAIGAWLSFSIRRVNLSFEDLITLEDDRLNPSMRIVFVIGLTMTACLLFWTGAMNIEIGLLKTTQFGGSKAFLIGLFAGLAERALATAISGRAASFVRSIAGGG